MDKLNIYNYEILIKQKNDRYLAFCPQLNIIFKDIDEDKVYHKIRKHIENYIHSIRIKNKIDKKEIDFIKEQAVHDVEEELKENLDGIKENESQFESLPEQFFSNQADKNADDINTSEYDGIIINDDYLI